MNEHGTATEADKQLDAKPEKSHEFLSKRERLVEMKKSDPSSRVTASVNIFGAEESITMAETQRHGLQGPKTKFMEISVFVRKFGQPAPERIKTKLFKGKQITGVDIIDSEDFWERACSNVPNKQTHPSLSCFEHVDLKKSKETIAGRGHLHLHR